MPTTPLLFMPFLHKEFCPAALPSSLLQLWAGLPNPQDGFYVPTNFPLGPQEAAQYVEHVRNIGIAVADNIPVHSLLAAEKQTRHPGMLQETRDIAAFAKGEEIEPAAAWRMREAGLAAQRALLRIWLLEERHLEIRQLEQRCRALSGDFGVALGIELEEEDALQMIQHMQSLDDTPAATVPWRFFLENAALFLPERSTLLCTDRSICSELSETTLRFMQTHAACYFPGQTPPTRAPDVAESPLWQALGMKRAPAERPWLTKVFSFLLWDDTR